MERLLHDKRIFFSVVSGLGVIVLAVLIASILYFFQWKAPQNFPDLPLFSVSEGDSLTKIAHELEEKNFIRSSFWFTNFVILFKHERQAMKGEYYFEGPLSVYEIARRVTSGDTHLAQLRTTIPEGSTAFEISQIIKKRYPGFNDITFLTLARNKEGYLFPDTYLFGSDIRPEKVMSVLMDEFDEKIKQPDIAAKINAFNQSLEDIVTMASILEGEARQTKTRQIVAGILWRRLKLGMPLQVDATFKYINGKSTSDLTLNDLKIDSPYNTYVYKGLPPTPISNPGLDAITAAVTPIATDYLYFLTDSEGTMHYASTLEEHAANKNKYLK